jgi:CHAT domain-containing protein
LCPALPKWAAALLLPVLVFGQDGLLEKHKVAIAAAEKLIFAARQTGTKDFAGFASVAEDLVRGEAELTAAGRTSEAALNAVYAGTCYRLMGKRDIAYKCSLRGLELARTARSASHQVRALRGLGLLDVDARKFSDAAVHFKEALRLAADAGDKHAYLETLEFSSGVYAGVRDFNAATEICNRIIAQADPSEPRGYLSGAYRSRASAFYEVAVEYGRRGGDALPRALSLLDAAMADAAQARDIDKKIGYTFLAGIDDQLIRTFTLQKQTFGAAHQMESTKPGERMPNPAKLYREMLSEIDTRTRQLNATQDALGMKRSSDEDHTGALKQLEAEIEELDTSLRLSPLRPNDPAPSTRITSAHPISPGEVVRLPLVPPADANLWLQITAIMSWVTNHPDDRVREAFSRATAHQTNGRIEKALTALMELLALLDDERAMVGDDRARSRYLEDKVRLYDAVTLHLLKAERFAEAFDMIERVRARGLAELMAGRSPELPDARQRAAVSEALRLKAEIQSAQRAAFRSEGAATSALPTLQKQYDAALERIGKDLPEVLPLLAAQLTRLDTLQQLAARDDFDVLQYVITDEGVAIWHIGRDSSTALAVSLPRKHLQAKVQQLRGDIARGQRDVRFDATTASELFLFLVQPVLQKIKSRHLVIFPRDELSAITFAALRNPQTGRYLIEDYRLSIAPSATVLAGLRKIDSLAGAKTVSIAGVDLENREDQMLRKLFPGHSSLVRPPKSDLLVKLKGFDVVHLQAHGEYPANEDPMLARVLLRDLAGKPEAVTAAEMTGWPLRGTKLVAVAACRSGQVDAVPTTEMFGLARTLLYAGAQSLVLASWDVNDASARLWMETFYTEARLRPLAEAAQLASIAVKRKFTNPHDWAPFIFIGR